MKDTNHNNTVSIINIDHDSTSSCTPQRRRRDNNNNDNDNNNNKNNNAVVTMAQIIQQFESHYYTPRQVALLRINLASDRTHISDDLNNDNDDDDDGNNNEPKNYDCATSNDGGLATIFVPAMISAVTDFIQHHTKTDSNSSNCFDTTSIHIQNDSFHKLHRLLFIYLRWVQIDTILGEELARYGAHTILIQLLQLQCITITPPRTTTVPTIQNDHIEDIQDIAGEIAAASRPLFPLLINYNNNINPYYTRQELQQRLPISISLLLLSSCHNNNDIINNNNSNNNNYNIPITVFIHQICSRRQSAQVDVGFVLWPSAVVLSSWLVRNASTWQPTTTTTTSSTLTVLELGAGCGLSGLVAATCLQNYSNNMDRSVNVILSDFNSMVLENLQQNIHLNDLSDICTVVGLDFYQQAGQFGQATHWIAMDGSEKEQVDIVIAADIICQPSDAIAVANTLHDTLKPNGTGVAYIVCADAQHRFGVDHLQKECQRVGLTISTKNIVHCNDNDSTIDTTTDHNDDDTIRLHDDDIRNLQLTTGYVHGMKLTLFIITTQ